METKLSTPPSHFFTHWNPPSSIILRCNVKSTSWFSKLQCKTARRCDWKKRMVGMSSCTACCVNLDDLKQVVGGWYTWSVLKSFRVNQLKMTQNGCTDDTRMWQNWLRFTRSLVRAPKISILTLGVWRKLQIEKWHFAYQHDSFVNQQNQNSPSSSWWVAQLVFFECY